MYGKQRLKFITLLIMEMDFKICFVCTGNACRAPFAECVTRKLLADAGMQHFKVYSLGTVNWGDNPRDAIMTEERHRWVIS